MEVAKDFEEFFASFNAHRVQYLIVGGYALALHAQPRYTGDMDVFVAANKSNAHGIEKALVEDIAQSFYCNLQSLCVGCVQFGRILFLSSAAANLTSPVFPILRASTSATNS